MTNDYIDNDNLSSSSVLDKYLQDAIPDSENLSEDGIRKYLDEIGVVTENKVNQDFDIGKNSLGPVHKYLEDESKMINSIIEKFKNSKVPEQQINQIINQPISYITKVVEAIRKNPEMEITKIVDEYTNNLPSISTEDYSPVNSGRDIAQNEELRASNLSSIDNQTSNSDNRGVDNFSSKFNEEVEKSVIPENKNITRNDISNVTEKLIIEQEDIKEKINPSSEGLSPSINNEQNIIEQYFSKTDNNEVKDRDLISSVEKYIIDNDNKILNRNVDGSLDTKNLDNIISKEENNNKSKSNILEVISSEDKIEKSEYSNSSGHFESENLPKVYQQSQPQSLPLFLGESDKVNELKIPTISSELIQNNILGDTTNLESNIIKEIDNASNDNDNTNTPDNLVSSVEKVIAEEYTNNDELAHKNEKVNYPERSDYYSENLKDKLGAVSSNNKIINSILESNNINQVPDSNSIRNIENNNYFDNTTKASSMTLPEENAGLVNSPELQALRSTASTQGLVDEVDNNVKIGGGPVPEGGVTETKYLGDKIISQEITLNPTPPSDAKETVKKSLPGASEDKVNKVAKEMVAAHEFQHVADANEGRVGESNPQRTAERFLLDQAEEHKNNVLNNSGDIQPIALQEYHAKTDQFNIGTNINSSVPMDGKTSVSNIINQYDDNQENFSTNNTNNYPLPSSIGNIYEKTKQDNDNITSDFYSNIDNSPVNAIMGASEQAERDVGSDSHVGSKNFYNNINSKNIYSGTPTGESESLINNYYDNLNDKTGDISNITSNYLNQDASTRNYMTQKSISEIVSSEFTKASESDSSANQNININFNPEISVKTAQNKKAIMESLESQLSKTMDSVLEKVAEEIKRNNVK